MFVFTSCTNNYIPKARVLASTLKSFHPDWTFCLLLGEAPPAGFALENEPFDRLVTFDQLDIPNYKTWLFRHRVVEICTAAKGPALFHFLAREGHEKVMYLDPDIMVCNSLAPLESMLDEHDVLLTPHQLAPQETQQSIVDNELCAMQYGVFNLGFVAAAKRGDGLGFARWWRSRLLQYCYDDIPRGLFTDQRWCDLAPAFFPKLHIVRDAGCNAASWNLTDRTITRARDGSFLANKGPLRFYHFTGFDSGAGKGMTARYAEDMPAVHELWDIYRDRLTASGHAELGKVRWAHMAFDDGTPITDDMRITYRNRDDMRHAFPDPFARPGYLEWYRDEKDRTANRIRGKLGPLYRKARYLLEANGGFPRGLPGTIREIMAWVRKSGIRGVMRKICCGPQESALPVAKLPKLRSLLDNPKNPDALRLFRMLAPSYSPVCVVEHDWGGGADDYCRKRVDALLAEGRSVIRLRYVNRTSRVEMQICQGQEQALYEVADIHDLADSRFPRIHDVIVNEFAGWYRRHHDVSWTVSKVQQAVLALVKVARHHKAHVELLFHDYYAVCPTIVLFTPDHEFCGSPQDTNVCDACALDGNPFSMADWRSAWGELISLADELVFFSKDTRDRVASVYALRPDQVYVRPHAVEGFGVTVSIPPSGPMCIAVVGNIQRHKGADMVIELADLLDKEAPEASILVFGGLDVGHVPHNVTVLGHYKREELPGLLEKHGVTVGFFSSVWPETFSFVTHELASLSLPLVAFPLGAQEEYVKTLSNSRVAASLSARAALGSLLELDAERQGPHSLTP